MDKLLGEALVRFWFAFIGATAMVIAIKLEIPKYKIFHSFIGVVFGMASGFALFYFAKIYLGF
jgi:hypothetical protein